MGVRSISGQDFAALALTKVARTPAPVPGTSDGGQESAVPARQRAGPEKEQVRQTAEQAANVSTVEQRTGTRLRVDESTKRVVAQIIDSNNEVIKQIPPEELLTLAAKSREIEGRLFDRTI